MSNRPSTSKPRGVCKYYKESTRSGCLNGNSCKFLHGDGETMSPYDKRKRCKFYAAGFCKHGDQCWFRHAGSVSAASLLEAPLDNAQASTSGNTGDEDDICCICQEKPVTYGLLTGCSHICCLKCLREWRDRHNKPQDIIESGNTKKCPYCRATSLFIVPSSVFYTESDPRKSEVIERYKSSMARIPCKYFERSPPNRRSCPYGRDCFYRHQKADGTPYVFPHGASYYLNRGHDRGPFTNYWPTIPRNAEPIDVLRTLTEIRSRMVSLSLAPSSNRNNDNDVEDIVIGRLMESVLTSLESAITNSSEDEERSPPPTSSILASSEDASLQTHSALPLTRAYMDLHYPAGENARERQRAARDRFDLSGSWLEAESTYSSSESESSSYNFNGTSDSEDTEDLEESQVMRTAGHTPPPHLLRRIMDELDVDLTDEEEDEVEVQTSYSSRTASPHHWTAPLGFRYSEPTIATVTTVTSERLESVSSDLSPDSLLTRTPPFDQSILDGDMDLRESTGAAEEYIGAGNENFTSTPITNNIENIASESVLLNSNNTPQHEETRETLPRQSPENDRPKEFRRMKSHTGISRSSAGVASSERETTSRRRRPTSQNFVTDGRGRVVATDDGGVDNALSAWFLPASPLALVLPGDVDPIPADALPPSE